MPVSQGSPRWNPSEVLQIVHPDYVNVFGRTKRTCHALTKKHTRCKLFRDAYDLSQAEIILRNMSFSDPAVFLREDEQLRRLAGQVMCRRWHLGDPDQIRYAIRVWKRLIQEWIHEQAQLSSSPSASDDDSSDGDDSDGDGYVSDDSIVIVPSVRDRRQSSQDNGYASDRTAVTVVHIPGDRRQPRHNYGSASDKSTVIITSVENRRQSSHDAPPPRHQTRASSTTLSQASREQSDEPRTAASSSQKSQRSGSSALQGDIVVRSQLQRAKVSNVRPVLLSEDDIRKARSVAPSPSSRREQSANSLAAQRSRSSTLQGDTTAQSQQPARTPNARHGLSTEDDSRRALSAAPSPAPCQEQSNKPRAASNALTAQRNRSSTLQGDTTAQSQQPARTPNTRPAPSIEDDSRRTRSAAPSPALSQRERSATLDHDNFAPFLRGAPRRRGIPTSDTHRPRQPQVHPPENDISTDHATLNIYLRGIPRRRGIPVNDAPRRQQSQSQSQSQSQENEDAPDRDIPEVYLREAPRRRGVPVSNTSQRRQQQPQPQPTKNEHSANELSRMVQELTRRIRTMEAENANIQEQRRELGQENARLARENAQQRVQIANLEDEHSDLEEQINEQFEEINRYRRGSDDSD